MVERKSGMSETKEKLFKIFLAGQSSVIAAMFVHPVDTMKIRM
jgi:hypothetical protein